MFGLGAVTALGRGAHTAAPTALRKDRRSIGGFNRRSVVMQHFLSRDAE